MICLYDDRVNNLHANTKGNMREWLWSAFPLYWTASQIFPPHPPSRIPKSYVLSFSLVRIAEDIDWAACEQPSFCLRFGLHLRVARNDSSAQDYENLVIDKENNGPIVPWIHLDVTLARLT